MKIVKFALEDRPTRSMALGCLKSHSVRFPPESFDGIGKDLFFGWRFVRGSDGIVYFADGVSAGITRYELIS